MDSNVNPILVEAYRGEAVESRHRGAYAVVGPGGSLTSRTGDIDTPVYPRSAIKVPICIATRSSVSGSVRARVRKRNAFSYRCTSGSPKGWVLQT